MTTFAAILAVLSGTAAALFAYLASSHQQWRAAGRWPSRWRWWPGVVCALVSLAAMLRLLAPMEAAFAWSILLMLAASVMPFLGAWRALSRAGGAP
ncbi:hypothetical protein [Piscinibacter sp.]|uniref:hypothetical protein n=1 Tax=Piscinibacter sp. TaxID=1903157 RepID=UPI0039E33C83